MKPSKFYIRKRDKGCRCRICMKNLVEGYDRKMDAILARKDYAERNMEYDWDVVGSVEDDDVLPFGIGGIER